VSAAPPVPLRGPASTSWQLCEEQQGTPTGRSRDLLTRCRPGTEHSRHGLSCHTDRQTTRLDDKKGGVS